jgi:hypothetical protein
MRDRLASAAGIAIFAVFIFIALEMTFRVYLFGMSGLSPAKVNSFINIFHSGLVQPADDLQVWYALKPNQQTLFRGAPFRTNSHGLADDEYSYAKAPNTYRVAVVGSSWTMGAGVDIADAFHSQLEHDLSQTSDSLQYEFINFGVENYGLGEMMATVKRKAMRYDPDMILFVITGFTPTIRWTPHEEAFVQIPRKNPGWSSYAGLRLAGALGLSSKELNYNEGLRDIARKQEKGLYSKQLQRAANELAAISSANEIPVALVWLRLNKNGADDKLATVFIERAEKVNLTAVVVDLETYLEADEPVSKLLVNRSESHPNKHGHSIIAADLKKKIFSTGAPAYQEP